MEMSSLRQLYQLSMVFVLFVHDKYGKDNFTITTNAVSVKDNFPMFEMSGWLARWLMKFHLMFTYCYA